MAAPTPPPVPAATIEWVVSELRATRTATNEQRKLVTQRLVSNAKSPQFNTFLVQILAVRPNPVEMEVRQLAGLLLKQNVEQHFATWPAATQEAVKATLLTGMSDPDRHLRRTVSSCITCVISAVKLLGWKQLLPAIVKQLAPGVAEAAMDGALRTVTLLCEDWALDMNSEALGWPLNHLIPKLILFFKHPQAGFRRLALKSLINFIFDMPAAMTTSLPAYLAGLSALTRDKDAVVRKVVCDSLVSLTEERLDVLMPHIGPIIGFLIHCMNDEDDRVQLAACEFWSPFVDNAGEHAGMLVEHFPTLIPAMWKCMRYSEEELADLPVEDVADEGTADREEDVAPYIYKGAGASSSSSDTGQWTVRRCAAYTLDHFASVFTTHLLTALMPGLQQRFTCTDDRLWLDREAGILAFGAVVSGCKAAFKPAFPRLFPTLLALVDHTRPLIRSIACWALSRISDWVAEQPDDKAYTNALLAKLCAHMLDHNKKVQESACSAFAVLAEHAGKKLAGFVVPILDTINSAFTKYQAKNVFILYDAVGTFCDCMGAGVLNNATVIAKVLAPLTKRWNALRDDDRALCPLLECMTSVARGLGPGFVTSAPTVYKRCVTLLESNLVAVRAAEDSGEVREEGELEELRDFIILALDMMSALCEALGGHVATLFASHNVLSLIHECMKDSNTSVRQSACGAVGDIAKTAPKLLAPGLKEVLAVLVLNLRDEHEFVCNNASWAIGELAVRLPEQVRPFAAHIVPKLASILNADENSNLLRENTAISLGRLSLTAAAEVAPLAPTFVANFLAQLRHVREPEERAHAFQGLAQLLSHNNAAVAPHFGKLCDAIVAWKKPSAEILALFKAIIQAFQVYFAANWPRAIAALHPETRAAMATHFAS